MSLFLTSIGRLVTTSLAGTAIVTPIVVIFNNSPKIALNNFPKEYQSKYQKYCQVLIKDTNNEKYLLVCNEGPHDFKINFYSEGKTPIWIRKLSGEKNENGTVKLIVELDKESIDQINVRKEEMQIPLYSWTNKLDILEKELEQCGFLYKGNTNKQWTIRCPKECRKGRVIYSTPLAFNGQEK